jgi:hypothetical protein
MRWLLVLAIVGFAQQSRADGCSVTTPSGQILFVREVLATLPPPLLFRGAMTRPITGAALGRLISEPLRRQLWIDAKMLREPTKTPTIPSQPPRYIVELELRIDECAPTDA